MIDAFKDKRIAVLCGGISAEREVSFRSGQFVFDCLERLGYSTIRLDPMVDNLCDEEFDVAFIALHGTFGEDGTVQEILEALRISYTGSGVEASRLAFDKWGLRQLLLRQGVPVPESRLLGRLDPIPQEGVVFPLVVKPVCQGSSIGLSIAEDPESLSAAVLEAFRYDQRLLLEEYIKGREMTKNHLRPGRIFCI
jgi:D-alanine-D-alanine ligase